METEKTQDNGSTSKEPTRSYDDAHTPVPMVAFGTNVGSYEAFEYISLARATMNRARDTIQLFFAPATVTIGLKDPGDRKKDAKKWEFFKGFLGHSIQTVNLGGDLVSSVSVEITEQEEFEGAEIGGSEDN